MATSIYSVHGQLRPRRLRSLTKGTQLLWGGGWALVMGLNSAVSFHELNNYTSFKDPEGPTSMFRWDVIWERIGLTRLGRQGMMGGQGEQSYSLDYYFEEYKILVLRKVVDGGRGGRWGRGRRKRERERAADK